MKIKDLIKLSYEDTVKPEATPIGSFFVYHIA